MTASERPDAMELGSRLHNARKAIKWTQQAVAKRVGVRRATISQWETGREIPGRDRLLALAKILNVSIEELTSRRLETKVTSTATSVDGPGSDLLGEALQRLWQVIDTRRDADPEMSYTARLLGRGSAKVAQKFGEEAVEAVIEGVRGDKAALIGESADVLYHLLVLWAAAGVTPADVAGELTRREGTSGIAEKRARRSS